MAARTSDGASLLSDELEAIRPASLPLSHTVLVEGTCGWLQAPGVTANTTYLPATTAATAAAGVPYFGGSSGGSGGGGVSVNPLCLGTCTASDGVGLLTPMS